MQFHPTTIYFIFIFLMMIINKQINKSPYYSLNMLYPPIGELLIFLIGYEFLDNFPFIHLSIHYIYYEKIDTHCIRLYEYLDANCQIILMQLHTSNSNTKISS